MENPYQSPQAPQDVRPKPRSGTLSFIGGLICCTLAFAGLSQGIVLPEGAKGDALDHLPYVIGQLSCPAVLIIIGTFLLWQGYRAKRSLAAPAASLPTHRSDSQGH